MLHLISQKPVFGYLFAAGGFFSGLLTWLQILTPAIGFIGACLGALAGFYTLLIKVREWKRGK